VIEEFGSKHSYKVEKSVEEEVRNTRHQEIVNKNMMDEPAVIIVSNTNISYLNNISVQHVY
jgi:histidinol dehydrogenase